MNTALRPSRRARACGLPLGTNCGRKAKKNRVSFGFSRLTRTAERMTRAEVLGAASGWTLSRLWSRQVDQAMYSR